MSLWPLLHPSTSALWAKSETVKVSDNVQLSGCAKICHALPRPAICFMGCLDLQKNDLALLARIKGLFCKYIISQISSDFIQRHQSLIKCIFGRWGLTAPVLFPVSQPPYAWQYHLSLFNWCGWPTVTFWSTILQKVIIVDGCLQTGSNSWWIWTNRAMKSSTGAQFSLWEEQLHWQNCVFHKKLLSGKVKK